ncbi:hypothetical protein [Pinibacter soli]|uniref:Nuclear transport factor 2 family protein n=1 Tax=Pinibacter soli TaxID=3044211 RepID=A0ABT6RAM2_9BACT|nr:hypothetical protein [Pinibacter soli]MDI3319629.1 hypothetical protein [Pinibacter soli]
MKYYIMIVVLLCSNKIHAQNSGQSIVNAERAFAAMSTRVGINKSFTANFDTSCVVFVKGKAVNGYQLYGNNVGRGGVLNWEPEYVGISSTKHIGFSTGPYTYKQSANDTVSGRGQFTTIWKFNENSEWKAVLDMGASYGSNNERVTAVKIFTSDFNSTKVAKSQNALSIENDFINEYQKVGKLAFNNHITNDSWFNRKNHHPYYGLENLRAAVASIPDTLHFAPIAGELSQSGDFAYVYGNVMTHENVENYLRVWIRKGKEWKLILQVLNW